MNENPIQPPDMAGVIPPPPDPAAAVGLLRSHGSLPPMPGIGQPDPGLAAGSGMLAALQGHSWNPYLQQQQGQSRMAMQAQQQMFEQQQQMQQMEEQKKARLYAQNKDFLEIGKSFLKSNDQASIDAGTKIIGDSLQAMGIPVPKAALTGLRDKTIDPGQAKMAGRWIESGMDPQHVAEITGLSLPIVVEMASNRGSEGFSEIVYGKSLTQRKQEVASLKSTETATWVQEHPEYNTPAGAEANIAAMERFKKPLLALPDEDRAAMLRFGQAAVLQKTIEAEKRKMAGEIALAQIKAHMKEVGQSFDKQQVGSLYSAHSIVLLSPKGDIYAGMPSDTAEMAKAQGFTIPLKIQETEKIKAGRQSFQLFSNMRSQAAVLAQQGLLQQAADAYDKTHNPGWMSRVGSAVGFKAAGSTFHPEVVKWLGMESDMIIALRNLGEKGVRAQQAFQGAISTMHAGSYSAIDEYLRQLELTGQAGLDPRFKGAFRTEFRVKDKKSGKEGTLFVDPGDGLDLTKYEVIPQFGVRP